MSRLALWSKVNRRLGTILLVFTLALASFLRLYQLSALPPAVHPGEAVWFVLAKQLLADPVEFLRSSGGPQLGFIVHISLGAIIQTINESIVVVRAMNAGFGILTVLGVYALAKAWFGRRPALIAAFLLAVSPWAITLSRSNLPVNIAMLVFVWLGVVVTRAYRSGKWPYWAASILLVIIGCMSARIFWVVPFLYLATLIVALVRKKVRLTQNLLVVCVISVVALVLLAALAVGFGGGNPARGLSKVLNNQSIGTGIASQGRLVVENVSKTVAMFFVRGDENNQVNLGGLPMMNVFVGLMLLLGLFVAFAQRTRLSYVFLLITLVGCLLPGLFVAAAPDAYRTALVLPVAMILAGVGANYLLRRWYGMFPVNTTARTLGLSLVILLLLLTGYQGYRQYFVAWAQDPVTFLAHREDLRTVAGLGAQNGVYVVASSQDGSTLAAYRQTKGLQLGSIDDLEKQPVSKRPRYVIVLINGSTAEIKKRVEAKYPGSIYQEVRSEFDERVLFGKYEVK